MLKVVLFVGIVLLGNFGRLFLRRRDAAASTERLRRSVLVEVVLAIGVLVATSVLVAEPRGKEAVAVAQARPRSATASLGGGRHGHRHVRSGQARRHPDYGGAERWARSRSRSRRPRRCRPSSSGRFRSDSQPTGAISTGPAAWCCRRRATGWFSWS